MVQIGNVKKIIELKDKLNELKIEGYIKEWQMPYENTLTRLEAAWIFFSPSSKKSIKVIEQEMNVSNLTIKINDKGISNLPYIMSFQEN